MRQRACGCHDLSCCGHNIVASTLVSFAALAWNQAERRSSHPSSPSAGAPAAARIAQEVRRSLPELLKIVVTPAPGHFAIHEMQDTHLRQPNSFASGSQVLDLASVRCVYGDPVGQLVGRPLRDLQWSPLRLEKRPTARRKGHAALQRFRPHKHEWLRQRRKYSARRSGELQASSARRMASIFCSGLIAIILAPSRQGPWFTSTRNFIGFGNHRPNILRRIGAK